MERNKMGQPTCRYYGGISCTRKPCYESL